jgi:hypothetical protein
VGQSRDQHVRQIRHGHLLLSEGNIIRHPMRREGSQIGIENRISRARVAITRLADAPGIDEVPARQQINPLIVR